MIWSRSLRAASIVAVPLALAGCSVGAVPADVTAVAIVHESADGAELTVELELVNHRADAIGAHAWRLPGAGAGGDLFEVLRDGEPVAYRGPITRRAGAAGDVIELAPGEGIVRSAPLSRLYDFSSAGEYSIRLRATAEELLTDPSATLAAEPAVVRTTRALAALDLIEIGESHACTDEQRQTAEAAEGPASERASAAVGRLGDLEAVRDSYETWFGSHDVDRFDRVRSSFTAIVDRLAERPLPYRCPVDGADYCSANTIAYVYVADPDGPIYLCSLFFSTDRVHTILHEVSHQAAGTNDYVYGADRALKLAIDSPGLAIRSAENYTFFALE